MKRQMHGVGVDGWMDGWTTGWKDGWMDGWMDEYEWMGRQTDGRVDMNGWVDR